MKRILGILGLAAACGACCALPLMLPALGGIAASGVGLALGWQTAVLAGLASAVSVAVLLRRRQSKAAACIPNASGTANACGDGCGSGHASAKRGAA